MTDSRPNSPSDDEENHEGFAEPPSSPEPMSDIKHRFILRSWPRDPRGEVLDRGNAPKGKRAANGIDLWGETLLDFYFTDQFHGLRTIVSGSKMAAWMQQLGELDWAKDEIYWADHVEGEPFEVPPYNIGLLIEDFEKIVRSIAKYKTQVAPPSVENPSEPSSESVFDYGNYVSPWPLVPFSTTPSPPYLQKRISYHLLPRKLVVHDPWDVLSVTGSTNDDDAEWDSRPDQVYTYHIQMPEDLRSKAEEKYAEEARAKRAFADKRRLLFIRGVDVLASTLPQDPVLFMGQLWQPRHTSIPEAHLYLSPAHRISTGNHSFVYNAEWELPRSLLVNDFLCSACMKADQADILKNGRGVTRTGRITFPAHLFEDKAKTAGCQLTLLVDPASLECAEESLSSGDESPAGTSAGTTEVGHLVATKRVMQRDEEKHASSDLVYDCTYTGPYIIVHSKVAWQDPERGPFCEHTSRKVSLTAKVRVAAKLSLEDDMHLAREARSYMAFPSHLFEHWNGYNIIRPLNNPVPIGAVVPQFYGYYVPEAKTDNDSKHLSPIMLLEHCGVPVDLGSLGIDDREECASLYFRFHLAGWNHGSVATRNILVQPGPIYSSPSNRSHAEKSIRLIDFGRSYVRQDDVITGEQSEMAFCRLFQVYLYEHERPFEYAPSLEVTVLVRKSRKKVETRPVHLQ